MEKKLAGDQVIFGLDIGTRSVVGIVGYKSVGSFNIIADYVAMHDTRSMIDGQIHDVAKVTATIVKVKQELENQIGFPLKEVCIAAAGRVLKTCLVHVQQEIDTNVIVDTDRIYALELLGIEKAHQEIHAITAKEDSGFHCVGYSVSKYYLNGYEITKLEGHKGKKIGADILATFLPKEVVESLYQVVHKAGLEVKNLTLEPIAAIDVAIPPNYRLLNIALVDIGAGTSDIAITKDGSIIAYGMIPIACDEITESIIHQYLIDFKTAEKIKIKSSGKSKQISFKDIMGVSHKVDMDAIRDATKASMTSLAHDIGKKIIELNNNQPTNAVFVVGGGGQINGFDTALAKVLNLPNERVALRGKEVLSMVEFTSKTKKGPEMVTPIGICYTAMDNGKYDFIQVFFNDEPVKVFNANSITVMDIAAFKGYDPKRLLVSRGEELVFQFNGRERIIKGQPGTPPVIMINNQAASMADPVLMNDYITIINAKKGEPGSISTNQLKREIDPIAFSINNETYEMKPNLRLNGEVVSLNYDLKNNDMITLEPPTIQEAFVKFNIKYNQTTLFANGPEVNLDYKIQQNDIILFDAYVTSESKSDKTTQQQKHESVPEAINLDTADSISVIVNQQTVKLTGKKDYIFVDVFDYINFDRTKPQGNLVCKINGANTSYMEPIKHLDVVEIYWDQ